MIRRFIHSRLCHYKITRFFAVRTEVSPRNACQFQVGPVSSISAAWSICKAVGALALHILIPDIIDLATQLSMIR